MSSKNLKLICRVASTWVMIETAQECRNSPVSRAKLVGDTLKRHLLVNRREKIRELKKMLAEANESQSVVLRANWQAYLRKYESQAMIPINH